ncbi:deoxyguanosinetriphosphate triphosphohydrolase [Rhizobium sp. Root708]|uniref:anti-phage deoxyguanosine triphosphatase n=1 Tax=Rhizobium sp. Root708 TaxID=1736592 RepID=UPI0006F38CA8|nr:anti-phage deoxyguanosine triphosphatase [Rhizobium sp. Root708]KRB49317.1 deoxyguanosinetriphosphate triphosphohydrolase [Rhizobium sp. Root708]
MDHWQLRESEWTPQPEDARGPFDVDYARIVHSGSFRRLQGKTQTLNLGDSDFYRTRLTHSLEVAQIGASIVRQLAAAKTHNAHDFLPPASLIQAIGFAHDLGHPPFGHGGEVSLNFCMRNNGGFEGNGHTLRILSRLENFSEKHGADLTRRALLGILKYPVSFKEAANPEIKPKIDATPQSIRVINRESSKPPKCYLDSEREVVDWILEPLSDDDRDLFISVDPELVDAKGKAKHRKPLHKSLDCSIMDVADDIAYGVHDLEDAIAMGLVSERDFREAINESACAPFLNSLNEKYSLANSNDVYESVVRALFGLGKERKHCIGRLVHHFVTHVEMTELEDFEEPLIRYRAKLHAPQRIFLDALQALIVTKVIRSAEVQHLEFKGQKMVVSVFEAFASDPRAFLPVDAYSDFVGAEDGARVICDHVAGMTDSFLLKTYDRLFSPRMGSVFDKL